MSVNMQVDPSQTSESFHELSLNESTGPSGPKLLGDYVDRRDSRAFADLVEMYSSLVYGVCRRVARNHHDAEDAFQATFLILSQKGASIKNRQLLASWLFRVAYQTSLRSKMQSDTQRAKELSMAQSSQPAAEPHSLWADLKPVLDCELNRLADKYRLPVLLCDLGGATQKQVASELGWSEGTVATRLAKARSILAHRLKQRGISLTAVTLSVLLSQQAASAAVPTALIASTIQTAGAITAGHAASAGVATSKVALLAKGTSQAMLATKAKLAVSLVLALSAAGVGQLAITMQADPPSAPQESREPRGAIAAAAPLTEFPEDIRRALEDNARQLSPITVSYTIQRKSKLPPQETFERLNVAGIRSPKLMLQQLSQRVIW